MSTQAQKKPVNSYTFLKYTGWFILLCAVIFSAFVISGKTFIWKSDGFHQHYPFFYEYLDMIREFFATGQWQSWNWSIGLGQDTLLTYGYYVIGDPFIYLGLLFPKGYEELAFHVVMLIRIWCVGASFLLYARKMAFSHYSALTSGLLYAFSHYVIYNVVRHPFFIHPMIFFPLLCLGIEKVFRKESGVLFIIMVAVSAASNFYFFYMLTLLMFLYALLRYRSYEKEKDWKVFWGWLGYFLSLYLIGLLISSFIFVPLVYGFLNSSRSASFPPISLFFYPIRYYILLLINSVTPGTIYWTVGGLSVVGVLSLPFLVNRRRQLPGLFWSFVIIGIMLLFPLFGSMMNGFSGPYNRFTFVVPFFLALALAYFMDHSSDLKTSDVTWMRRMMVGFSVLFLGASVVTNKYIFYLTPVVIGWFMYSLTRAKSQERVTLLRFRQGMLMLVMFNLAMNALNFYLPYGKNAMSETEDYGTIDEAYAGVFERADQLLPEEERYRIGVSSNDNHVRNQYVSIDKYGTNSYASLTNGRVAEFSQVIESSQYQIIQPLRNGIDDRRIANQALGVKYLLTEEENQAYLPSDYEINEEFSRNGILVAETENEAPFAYVENEGVSQETALDLHPVQRESLLADAVIVEKEKRNLQPLTEDIPLQTHQGTWKTTAGIDKVKTTTLEEPLDVRVTEENSEMTLTFEKPEALIGQEVFIYFEGIDFQPVETTSLVPASTGYSLTINFNDQKKSVTQSDKYSFSSYFKRDDILIHLNEVTVKENILTIQFENIGHYKMDKVSVASRPYNVTDASERAQKKKDQALIIDDFSNEYISGAVDASEEGMLVTSIPYSTGWKALVDGEEVTTEKVNIGFIGFPIAAGEHQVEFVYNTPFLTIGLFLTGLGLVGMVGYMTVYKQLAKREE